MKLRVLDLIVCPECSGNLSCVPEVTDEADVISGELICTECAAHYPIRRGIPRMLSGSLADDKQRTSDAFGWEWQEFRELHDMGRYREQFLDWILPIQPEFFADKIVLDAGCGMGRFALVSADFGAKEVLAIDLSEAVEAAAENARDYSNVHVIQGDIFKLPLRRRGKDGANHGDVDFAYSIGVLHHLPDPEEGFLSIIRHLNAKGSVFAWVYGRENNGWIVYLLNPIRHALSSRLPRRALYLLSYGLTVFLEIPLRLVYRPIQQHRALRFLQSILPYGAYLTWLSGYRLRHNHHVVFDHLVAPTAFYIRREDFENWFQRAGIADAQISWRNQNSWRGFGMLAGVDRTSD